MPKPPINPDSLDKVNFVIDAWTTGCDAPWYIYVETAKPALLAAFITLVTFGWDDVLRGYFRPKGLYKRRNQKRKGRWARALPRFPELGNTLGKQLPGATEVRGTRWNLLGKTLWRIDGAMEMVRFHWLVIAIAEDFAFNWTSLLYESYWCQPDAPGRFSYRIDLLHVLTGGHWYTCMFPWEDYEEAPPTWGWDAGSSGPDGCTVAAAITFKTYPGWPPPGGFATRIKDFFSGAVYGESNSDPEDISTEITMPVTGSIPPNRTFVVQIWTDLTFAQWGSGVVVGFGAPPT